MCVYCIRICMYIPYLKIHVSKKRKRKQKRTRKKLVHIRIYAKTQCAFVCCCFLLKNPTLSFSSMQVGRFSKTAPTTTDRPNNVSLLYIYICRNAIHSHIIHHQVNCVILFSFSIILSRSPRSQFVFSCVCIVVLERVTLKIS